MDKDKIVVSSQSEYDPTLRRIDRQAQYAFFDLQDINDKERGPPLANEDWMEFVQMLCEALVPAGTKTLSEIVGSIREEVKEQGAEEKTLADMSYCKDKGTGSTQSIEVDGMQESLCGLSAT